MRLVGSQCHHMMGVQRETCNISIAIEQSPNQRAFNFSNKDCQWGVEEIKREKVRQEMNRATGFGGFLCGSVVKNSPASSGDVGLISELERSLGERNGNPFQYSCLKNHMDRGDCGL